MTRPGSLANDTCVPSVAGSDTSGSCMPGKWRVPPSSTGAGILDQSTSSRFGWLAVGMRASLSQRLLRIWYLPIVRKPKA